MLALNIVSLRGVECAAVAFNRLRRLLTLRALVGLGGGTGVTGFSKKAKCDGFGSVELLVHIFLKSVFGVEGVSKSVRARSFLVCGGVSGGERTGEPHETPDEDVGEDFGIGIPFDLPLGRSGEKQPPSLLSSPLLQDPNSEFGRRIDRFIGVFSSYEMHPESLCSQ